MFSKFFKEIQENSYSMSISLDVRNYCFACWVHDAKALDCWFHHKLWICRQLVVENLDMSFWVQLHRSRSLNSLLSWFHPNGKSFAQPRKWEEGRNVLSNEFPRTAEKTNKQTNKNLDLDGKDTKTQSTWWDPQVFFKFTPILLYSEVPSKSPTP